MTEQPEHRPEVRASDAERDQVATLLNQAVGEGRLTLDEFTERVGMAYEASTRAELDRLVADLPVARPDGTPAEAGSAVAPAGAGGEKTKWKIAVLGGNKIKGRWRVRRRMGFFALLGENRIDLCDAELDAPEVEITIVSILADSKVIVPKGVRVVREDGFNLLSDTDYEVDESATLANSPVVRIRSYSLMADHKIRNPKPKKRRRWYDEDDED